MATAASPGEEAGGRRGHAPSPVPQPPPRGVGPCGLRARAGPERFAAASHPRELHLGENAARTRQGRSLTPPGNFDNPEAAWCPAAAAVSRPGNFPETTPVPLTSEEHSSQERLRARSPFRPGQHAAAPPAHRPPQPSQPLPRRHRPRQPSLHHPRPCHPVTASRPLTTPTPASPSPSPPPRTTADPHGPAPAAARPWPQPPPPETTA